MRHLLSVFCKVLTAQIKAGDMDKKTSLFSFPIFELFLYLFDKDHLIKLPTSTLRDIVPESNDSDLF